MRAVTKRDLNQQTAAVLARVTESGDIIVTEHGRPQCRISRFREHDAPLARMEGNGHYTPPSSSPTPWPDHPGGPAHTDDQVERLLDEVRGDC